MRDDRLPKSLPAEVPGVRGRSRPRKRFIDSVRSDLEFRGLILDERVPLKLLRTNPDGNRRPGRPRTRWKDSVESDLKTLRVSDWKTLARNRIDWRSMLEEVKTNRRL